MAGKKPAKVMAGQGKEVNKNLPGKAVKYFGSANAAPFICPTCNRSLTKGIIYEENNNSYCCRGCIPKTNQEA